MIRLWIVITGHYSGHTRQKNTRTFPFFPSISASGWFIRPEIFLSVCVKAVCLWKQSYVSETPWPDGRLTHKATGCIHHTIFRLSQRNETRGKFSDVIINRSQFTKRRSRMNVDCVAIWRLINHPVLLAASLWEINSSWEAIIARGVLQFSSGLVEG